MTAFGAQVSASHHDIGAEIEAQRHESLRGLNGRGDDIGISSSVKSLELNLIRDVFHSMEYSVAQEVLTVEFLGFASVRGYGIQVQFCGGRRVGDREVVDLVGRALCPKQGEQGGGYDLARWQKNNFDGFRECDNGCFADGLIGGDDLNARGVDGFRAVERDHHATIALVDVCRHGIPQVFASLRAVHCGGCFAWLAESG